jgi:hypothetical protein
MGIGEAVRGTDFRPVARSAYPPHSSPNEPAENAPAILSIAGGFKRSPSSSVARRLEGCEQGRGRTTELVLNRRFGHALRIGRRAALQVRQLAGHVVPNQIRPRAQHLTELDERGAQFAQCKPDADRRAEIHDVLARSPAEPPLHPSAGHLAKVIGETVSNCDSRDLAEPLRIAPMLAASFQAFTHGD